MRINHNISAMSAQRQLSINQSGNSKSLAKLASGLRINTAADDAAGLAISERMRAQIRGLNQAESNAQDGISLIQTAEGALQETTELVQRMRELAVQATSDIMTSTDRSAIETEMNQLRAEINRSANTLAYNGKKLFTGEMAASETQVKSEIVGGKTNIAGVLADDITVITDKEFTKLPAKDFKISIEEEGTNSKLILTSLDGKHRYEGPTKATTDVTANGIKEFGAFDIDDLGINIDLQNSTLAAAAMTGDETITIKTLDHKYELDAYEIKTSDQFKTDFAGVEISIGDNASVVGNLKIGYDISEDGKNYVFTLSDGIDTYYSEQKILTNDFGTEFTPTQTEMEDALDNVLNSLDTVTFEELDIKIDFGTSAKTVDDIVGKEFSAIKNPSSARIHVGANADDEGIDLAIADMTTGPNGLDLTETSISVSTATNARNTLDKLDEVLSKINTERANLGALQNRIESTVNNLALSAENLTSAESRIRDVDMAEQMVEYSKYNILNQAAMSMLAQANSQPNMVMNLLQGL